MRSTYSAGPGDDPVDLTGLMDGWKLNMAAARLSPQTIDSYLRGVRLYLRWCQSVETSAPPLSCHTLQSWVTYLLAQGAEPATARTRQQAVRRFAAWLVEEDEIDSDPFAGMPQPKLDTKVVQRLTDDELRVLIQGLRR